MAQQYFVLSFGLVLFTMIVCMFALRWELAERGVSTLAGRWSAWRLWRAAIALPGPKIRLMFWGWLMWISAVMVAGMLPFAAYFLYRSIQQ